MTSGCAPFPRYPPNTPTSNAITSMWNACCMRMVTNPERFDVIVTTNMFGRHHHRPGCRAPGRHGTGRIRQYQSRSHVPPACSSRYTGPRPTSPARGSPTPLAAILSLAMMLDHLEHTRAADRVREAVKRVLLNPSSRTPDLGGRQTTAEVGNAVRSLIA